MEKPSFWGMVLSLTCAATYLVGFAFLATVLSETGLGRTNADPRQIVQFLAENTALMRGWNLIIYVVNGLSLAGLAVIMSYIFQPRTPVFAKMVHAFGVLWATLVVGAGMIAIVSLEPISTLHQTDPNAAERLWLVLSTVENGLGGGTEIAGATWAAVVAAAGLRSRLFPLSFAIFSLLISASGICTLLGLWTDLTGAIFGIGFIIWFFWTAFILRDLRSQKTPFQKNIPMPPNDTNCQLSDTSGHIAMPSSFVNPAHNL